MRKDLIYKTILPLLGSTLLALGIIMLIARGRLINYVSYFAGAILFIHAVRNIFLIITRSDRLSMKRKKHMIFAAGFSVDGAVLAVLGPEIAFRIIVYVLCGYFAYNGLARAIDFVVAKLNRYKGHYYELGTSVFFFGSAVLMIVSSFRDDVFFVICAVYCMLFGSELLFDFVKVIAPGTFSSGKHRHIRISLPSFVSLFLPIKKLRYFTERDPDKGKRKKDAPQKEEKPPENGETPDLEILIHVSSYGSGWIGHLDLCLGEEVISFGNHNHSSHRLFGLLGDGVMFTTDRTTYLEYSVIHDRQLVLSYGIKLTPEQLSAVREEIERLKQETVPWKPPMQVDVEETGDETIDHNIYHDYSCDLWALTHAVFYRFVKGTFKTYSILSTNCVLLAEQILGKAGSDILCISAIASPGMYLDYLERLCLFRKTLIISKTVYDRKALRKLKKQKRKDEDKNERSIS